MSSQIRSINLTVFKKKYNYKKNVLNTTKNLTACPTYMTEKETILCIHTKMKTLSCSVSQHLFGHNNFAFISERYVFAQFSILG